LEGHRILFVAEMKSKSRGKKNRPISYEADVLAPL
jgi:hypothetical protein